MLVFLWYSSFKLKNVPRFTLKSSSSAWIIWKVVLFHVGTFLNVVVFCDIAAWNFKSVPRFTLKSRSSARITRKVVWFHMGTFAQWAARRQILSNDKLFSRIRMFLVVHRENFLFPLISCAVTRYPASSVLLAQKVKQKSREITIVI